MTKRFINDTKINFKNLDLKDSLPNNLVNIEDKTRSNLFTWRGQFSPQLIEQILLNYASEDDIVFDPFLGSGTVLFESILLGLEACGSEINPAAISFARVYELSNYNQEQIFKALNDVEMIVSKYTNALPFSQIQEINNFSEELIELLKISENRTVKIILMALITGMDFDAKRLDIKRINNVWGTLRSNIENLPFSDKKITCHQCDARKTSLTDNSIDFVVTSPPYINVFNYHQNYRKSVEKTGIDVLSVAKSEIGANRKFRQNRFLTVVQYCMDMASVFLELRRVCKKDAKIVFIVGRESNVKKTAFRNADLILSVAESCGFSIQGQQSRVFINKFGDSIYEEIMRFKVNDQVLRNVIEDARAIGQKALLEALDYCEENVFEEIQEAYEKSKNIELSPLLN